jgi:hypothetical protein
MFQETCRKKCFTCWWNFGNRLRCIRGVCTELTSARDSPNSDSTDGTHCDHLRGHEQFMNLRLYSLNCCKHGIYRIHEFGRLDLETHPSTGCLRLSTTNFEPEIVTCLLFQSALYMRHVRTSPWLVSQTVTMIRILSCVAVSS